MLKRIFANLLDQVIIFVISVLILLLAQVFMKGLGFKIVDAAAFLLIFYAVVNVFYYPICEGSKCAVTLGKKLLKIEA